MKASMASFQLAGTSIEYHHSTRIFSMPSGSMRVGMGSSDSRRGGASSSKLMNTAPPQVSQRTSTSDRSLGSLAASENSSSRYRKVLSPSRPQHHPWNGQVK